jgi:hypothetical protein
MPKKSNRSGLGRDFGGDVMDMARDRPLAAAAVAAAAVGAGVFLWSRRNQISDQLSDISNQIRDWSQSFPSPDDDSEFDQSDETTADTTRGISETGGGTGNLDARSGGAGTTGSISGRARGKGATPQATS